MTCKWVNTKSKTELSFCVEKSLLKAKRFDQPLNWVFFSGKKNMSRYNDNVYFVSGMLVTQQLNIV